MNIKRGDILLVNLEPVKGHEQGGIRPVLVIQNDTYNKHSPVLIIAAITSKQFTNEYPTNVFVSKEESKLKKDSTVLLNQIKTIDKQRIIKTIGSIDPFTIGKVDMALKISLAID